MNNFETFYKIISLKCEKYLIITISKTSKNQYLII